MYKLLVVRVYIIIFFFKSCNENNASTKYASLYIIIGIIRTWQGNKFTYEIINRKQFITQLVIYLYLDIVCLS